MGSVADVSRRGRSEEAEAWQRAEIDLRDVVFMDSSGLPGARAAQQSRARTQTSNWCWSSPSVQVLRLLELTGLRVALHDPRLTPPVGTLPRMATCLVTGGAGFLGSHLCEHLLERGNRVVCVDNLETGSLKNIEHLRGPEFQWVQTDITDYYEVDGPVDFIYHMASPASPIDYARLPLHTLKVGSYGTHHTLGVAKVKRARFLLASTSEVYGDPRDPPAARELLGQRQPDRPARRVRRGQALRRGADDGVPAGSRASTPASRGSSTPTARACGPTTAARSRPSSARR